MVDKEWNRERVPIHQATLQKAKTTSLSTINPDGEVSETRLGERGEGEGVAKGGNRNMEDCIMASVGKETKKASFSDWNAIVRLWHTE